MTRTRIASQLVALAALSLALAPTPASAQPVERIDGLLVDSAALVAGFDSAFLDVRLSGRTAELELVDFARIARDEGERALRNLLGGLELGRVSIGNGLGRPIAIVQETRVEGLRRLLLVVPRDLGTREAFRASRSVDYPYLVIDATVDAEGYGVGELYPAARLDVSPDGKLSYRSLTPLPMRILGLEAS